MTNEIDIRQALEAEAAAYEPPPDLAQRTIEAARALEEPSLLERTRAWRDARGARARVTGYPRWVYAGAAAAVLVAFFAVGRTVDRSGGLGIGGRVAPKAVLTTEPSGAPVPATDPQEIGATVSGPTLPGAGQSAALSTRPQPGSPGGRGGPADRQAAPTTIVPPQPPPNPGKFPPKVVKDASIEVKVGKARFESAWARANEIAARHGGFVTNSSTEMVRKRLARGTLTARVPADKLDAAMNDFRRLGTLVRMSSTGSDVSGQLVDYDARIRAAHAQEVQLLELLKQARSVSDTLEIRSRLDQVRQEIESMQAQKDRLQGQVDFATIQAAVYEPDAAPDDQRDTGRLGAAWDRAQDAVVTIVAGLVIATGYLGPFVVIALVAWALYALRRRRSA